MTNFTDTDLLDGAFKGCAVHRLLCFDVVWGTILRVTPRLVLDYCALASVTMVTWTIGRYKIAMAKSFRRKTMS